MVEDIDWDWDTDEDPVREAVMSVVREGEAEAIALIEGVEASVAERERLWLWLNVEDVDPDVVAIEDMVMDLLEDMETLSDEEGVLLGDLDGDTDWATDDVGVPEAGMVATSNPMTGGGTHSAGNAVTSAQGRAYTPN